MAFPYIFESSFEQGDATEWDGGETDTGGLLDFPHYTDLARTPGMELPFRGAYCMRVVCGDTNDHTVDEGSIDIADTATASLRFYLFIDKNFAATADDIFNIFEWQQAGGTVEAVISLQITASTDAVDIAIADGTEASSNFNPISKGVWHCIEAINNTETNASGTLDLIVDGATLTSLTSIDSAAAVGLGVLGTQNTLSTTTGTLLFDQFVFDDLQIGQIADRWSHDIYLTKSGHIFVGPGTVENITMISGAGTDCVMTLRDTDTADVTADNHKTILQNTANNEVVDPAGMPVHPIVRGAYVVLAGTNPRALAKVSGVQAFGSRGAVRNYALRRT